MLTNQEILPNLSQSSSIKEISLDSEIEKSYNFFNTSLLLWSSFASSCLPILIPCLEFNIEIESNSLMYNPNKAIRDKVFPLKIGKFSVKYYTFEELQ